MVPISNASAYPEIRSQLHIQHHTPPMQLALDTLFQIVTVRWLLQSVFG